MERSEPSLVPEWLRNSGNVSGGGNSAHHYVSAAHSPRNGCSKLGGDKNSRPFLDRTSSGNSRYSSSNKGSPKHPYSSFNRNPRERHRDKEKDKSLNRDLWDLDNVDPLGDILISRNEKDTLRRSHSLLCRKPSESVPQKLVHIRSFGNNNHPSNNGNGVHRAAFDKDFPSLGTEEKHRGGDVLRVSSPGLSTGMQSLIGGEGWKSALAEVPTIIGNNLRPISVQHIASPIVSSAVSSAVSSPLAGPNMAEALSQGPSRARTPPQLPDKAQMLEELAIKQSKQLIPMTPSMSKGLVQNSDKLKPKTSLRTSEPVVAAKTMQQQQPQPLSLQFNQGTRSGQIRSEGTDNLNLKSSNGGKFLVLKPLRENGVPVAKDVTGATNTLAGASVAASNVKSPNSSTASNVQQKVSTLSLNTRPFGEKRPSPSQVQSRNDFFKLMRKKSSSTASGSSSLVEKTAEVAEEADDSVNPGNAENGSKVTSNGDSHEVGKNLCLNGTVYPDAEEAAFLRSLGWDENDGEDEGLTEEEISAFYEEFTKMRPSLKLCRDVEQKITSLCESHTTGSSKASSELSFSGTEIEA